VADWKPRKLPRQARSRASFEAILGGCARVLERGGYESLTTNAVAAAAGVGIGTLYDFFPNRDAVVLALAEERLARLGEEVKAGLAEAAALDTHAALDLLIRRLVRTVAADRALYRVLLREPKLRSRPETRRALASFFELARLSAERAKGRLALADPPADAWLVSRILAHGVLDIVWQGRSELSRERLTVSLVRLAHRMLLGRDP
jgi:AcrR family transcriptional regulator